MGNIIYTRSNFYYSIFISLVNSLPTLYNIIVTNYLFWMKVHCVSIFFHSNNRKNVLNSRWGEMKACKEKEMKAKGNKM